MDARKLTAFFCLLCFLISGCKKYEISSLGESLAGNSTAKSTLPLNAGILHKRDQISLSEAESCVEVTQCFSRVLGETRIFETVIYPVVRAEDTDLILRVDFERTFKLYRLSNMGKNLLMLGSVFLLYPWLRMKVDYRIAGEVAVEKGGQVLKIYREEAASRVLMQFFAPVNETADALSGSVMRGVSNKLTRDILKDEAFFLASITKTGE